MQAPKVTNAAAAPPPGYRLHTTMDLTSTGPAVVIQALFVLAAAAMAGLALWADLPLSSSWGTWSTLVITLVACAVYMAAHELTHGLALRLLSDTGVTFAVRFPYLATGSEAFLGRRDFVVVALAPAAVWGVTLVVALLAVPADWFLTVYVVLALNFAGSAGDAVQAWATARLPRHALLRDDGRETSVFLSA